MFSSIGEGLKSLVINAIKITLLLVLLFAAINWAQHNPVVAQTMFSKLASAVASVITWACDKVIDWTS